MCTCDIYLQSDLKLVADKLVRDISLAVTESLGTFF